MSAMNAVEVAYGQGDMALGDAGKTSEYTHQMT
jgi:hypothetical protein